MVTYGKVEQLVDKHSVRVRIPLLNGAEGVQGQTPSDQLPIATFQVAPGTLPNFKVGDIVVVQFNDREQYQPVVLGNLSCENTDKYGGLSDIKALSLNVTQQTRLGQDTSIGDVTANDIQQLKGIRLNVQQQIDNSSRVFFGTEEHRSQTTRAIFNIRVDKSLFNIRPNDFIQVKFESDYTSSVLPVEFTLFMNVENSEVQRVITVNKDSQLSFKGGVYTLFVLKDDGKLHLLQNGSSQEHGGDERGTTTITYTDYTQTPQEQRHIYVQSANESDYSFTLPFVETPFASTDVYGLQKAHSYNGSIGSSVDRRVLIDTNGYLFVNRQSATDFGIIKTAGSGASQPYSEVQGQHPIITDINGVGYVIHNDITDYISTSKLGVANGVATLNNSGKVPTEQLPSYVDEIYEFPTVQDFPAVGQSAKIYVQTSTNLTYRWAGTQYTEISPSIALGETESTAYRGDRGQTAYQHTSLANNPHNVTYQQLGGTKPTYTAAEVGARASTWVPTKSDVGLSNVDNVRQYSQSNPPPYPVTSVNGKTGQVSLDQEFNGKQDKITSSNKLDYSLISGTPVIPSAVTEQTVSGWGFTKNQGTYIKPTGGIPYDDLQGQVKDSLDDVGQIQSKISNDIEPDISQVQQSVQGIEQIVSTQATQSNKLISQSEMGDALEAVEAKQLYKTSSQGSFATNADLISASVFYNADGTVATPTKNDVAYVLADETHDGKSAKYVVASINGGITWGFVITFSDTTFSQAQMDAINSGVTSAKRGSYDSHIQNTGIHVTAQDKTTWSGKQDAISDLNTIRSGAAKGATAMQEDDVYEYLSDHNYMTGSSVYGIVENAVSTKQDTISDLSTIRSGAALGQTAIQPEDLANVATSGNYNDLSNKPTIPQKKVWYGTCPTTASTANKVVTTGENFGFVAGNVLFVKFTNANTASSPKLSVDGGNQIAIYPTTSYMWQSGYVVGFVYDGTYFRDLTGPYATTTYYGVTKLSSAVNSTSSILAATPSQVKQAYDLAQSKMDQPTGGLVGQVFSKTSTGNQFQDLPQPTTRSQASYWTITFVEGTSFLDLLFPLGTSQHTATLEYNGVTYNTIQPDSSGNLKFGNDIVFSYGTWAHGNTITLYSYDTSDAQLYDFFFKPGYNTVVEHSGGSPEYIPGAIKAEITSDTTGVQQKIQSDGFAYVDTYSKQQIDQALSSYITDIANLVGGNA